MSDNEETVVGAAVAASIRWTCEACGCNTNTESDDLVSCGVCGTRRGPSLLRQGISRLVEGRGFGPDDDEDDDGEDEEDDEQEDDEIEEDDDSEHRTNNNGDSEANDASMLEAARIDDTSIPLRGNRTASARRLLRGVPGHGGFSSLQHHMAAARVGGRRGPGTPGSSSSTSQGPDPDVLLMLANENSALYQAKWSAQHKGSSISVDEENHPHVAHLAEGEEEGRCVRAKNPLPSLSPTGSAANRTRSRSGGTGSNTFTAPTRNENRRRGIFGWKVIFEHSNRDRGKNMGGCYLVGVTTGSFTSFSERSALQQSRSFWGIEDGGRRYEGGMGRRQSGSASGGHGMPLGRSEASRNSDNVLFGSREVLTVVADLELRSLTYWRDGRLLGTLVTGLPRTGNIYPVAVPFNSGVSVVITSIDVEPLSVLSTFHTAHKLAREAINQDRRRVLAKERSNLIHNGKISQKLRLTLSILFSWYSSIPVLFDNDSDFMCGSQDLIRSIDAISAARLWYRCGLRLSNLQTLLDVSRSKKEAFEVSSLESVGKTPHVTTNDFIALIIDVVNEEESSTESKICDRSLSQDLTQLDAAVAISGLTHPASFEVGDKVEVAEGFERFGDGSSGPLRPGDRGTVIEVQRGPNGDRQSVRVIFNGRRWWYQPQGLLSERSGLVESPAVRLITNILRVHGFDSMVSPLWGKRVTISSWKVGDLVVHESSTGKKCRKEDACHLNCFGRIMAENTLSRRDSGFIMVNFANAEDYTKRLKVGTLVHTTFFHNTLVADANDLGGESGHMSECKDREEIQDNSAHFGPKGNENSDEDEQDTHFESGGSASIVSAVLQKNISAVAKLDKTAISSLIKECRTSASLAGLFAAGLPDAILRGIDSADKGDIEVSALSVLGSLAVAVIRQLFTQRPLLESSIELGISSPTATVSSKAHREEENRSSLVVQRSFMNNMESNISNRLIDSRRISDFNFNSNSVNVRDLIRDLGVGAEQRRGVILALMANARMNDDARMASDAAAAVEDNHAQRGRHLLSSFGRLSAEAAQFGFSPSFQNLSQDETNSNSSSIAVPETAFQPRTLLLSVLRGAQCSGVSSSNVTMRRSISTHTKSLIHDGLLLNNIFWVKKTLNDGADAKLSRDEDDSPVLRLAIQLGCSTQILNSLIKSGSVVGDTELQESALSAQPKTLSLLLQHAVYIEGSINLGKCSPEIVNMLSQAMEKQRLQEEKMQRAAGEFASALLQKFILLALKYRLEEKTVHAKCLAKNLVGEILLHAMHDSQHQNVDKHTGDNPVRTEDGRVPAFTASSPFTAPSSSQEIFNQDCAKLEVGNSLYNSSTGRSGLPLSLLHSLPDSVFVTSFCVTDDHCDENDSLTTYLRLAESYLWSKDMTDASVGLTLVRELLRKIPAVSDEMNRFGIKHIAESHISMADEALMEIGLEENEDSLNSGNVDQMSAMNRVMNRASRKRAVVKCPQGHTTILHLTRHSSFRCDLCGKGVEQNKPMHGCRDCDWDACELCTDKAEGGLIKWNHIRTLAVEVQSMLEEEDEDANDEDESHHDMRHEELQRICRMICKRDIRGIRRLSDMLDIPGKVTMHEFANSVLPTLFFALIGQNNGQCLNEINLKIMTPKKRQSKRPRVGGGSSPRKRLYPDSTNSKYISGSHSKFSSHHCHHLSTDRLSFLNATVRSLIHSQREDIGFISSCDNTDASKHNNELLDKDEADKSEAEHMAEIEMNDSNDEDTESDENTNAEARSFSKKQKIGMPEILRRLHSVLAFYERVPVIQSSNKTLSDISKNGGELQSLIAPFEIELNLSRFIGDHNHVSSSIPYEPCSDLNGAIIHVEPLMPVSELQLHILRACHIQLPHYVRYCERLVKDQTIIAECPKNISVPVGSSKTASKHNGIWRLAKIVAFHEATGSHLVRYASSMYGNSSSFNNNAEDDVLCDLQSSQLEFNGRKTMLVLAAREYRIIYRSNLDDGSNFNVDRRCQDSVDDTELFMSGYGPNVPMKDSSPSLSPSHNSPVTMNKCNALFQGDEDPSPGRLINLPLGMRVESDCVLSGNDSLQVFTIISVEPYSPLLPGSTHEAGVDDYNTYGSHPHYGLVSDTGEIVLGVQYKKIRGHDSMLHQYQMQNTQSNRTQGLAPRQMSQQNSNSDISSGFTRHGHQNIFERGIPIASVSRASLSSQRSDRADGPFQSRQPSDATVGVLRRTWSALSPLQDMCPSDLSISLEGNKGHLSFNSTRTRRVLKISLEDDAEVRIDISNSEMPPLLTVDFGLHDSIPTTSLAHPEETTVFGGLQRLISMKESTQFKNIAFKRKCKLFYSISMQHESPTIGRSDHRNQNWQENSTPPSCFTPPWAGHRPLSDTTNTLGLASKLNADNILITQYSPFTRRRLRNVASRLGLLSNENQSAFIKGTRFSEIASQGHDASLTTSSSNEDPFDFQISLNQCKGLNVVSIQCLELLSILAEHFRSIAAADMVDDDKKGVQREVGENSELFTNMFISEALTGKLLQQLEDPLAVVGGALPDWCNITPVFASRVFSHSSRRRLLERAAFGISRAALRQQEAKVAVAPLRLRMAALRQRAVELVGEAFSGANDPTALQLQADELYGMEEALAARINAAFRAQRWDEHSLQCAKAAVRRDELLTDASAIMKSYANDAGVNRRRLEVRFEGESGFDAASGDEAGVTRGFYADVAEALLSCEHVAGVFNPPSLCSKVLMGAGLGEDLISTLYSSKEQLISKIRLPLWIPDIDASSKVIIPTPRADPLCVPGIYPRPISPQHELHGVILEQFRFMGRLFAAALRDSFLFPLPLSASFLKLVQAGGGCTLVGGQNENSNDFSNHNASPNMSMSVDEFCGGQSSHENSYLVSGGSALNDSLMIGDSSSSSVNMTADDSSKIFDVTPSRSGINGSMDYTLTNFDLPRPGFLGGEIFAVEQYICETLDKLEDEKVNLSAEEVIRQQQEIATDTSFARNALGKSYDCSFEEYFADRRFVDPLDPSQGEDAWPLCPNGASRPVTIDNVREWVVLAKRFFLYDGVIAQALSFREGINDFFCADALRLFTAEELQHDVCGGGDNVDNWDEKTIRSLFKLDGGKGAAEALIAVAAMGGEGGAALSRRFGPSSPTVGYLVKTLLEAGSTQRRQFLSFVTSVPIVTPGQIEVVPVVNPAGEFLAMKDPACLPRANTCARRLYLPKFENYESFSQVVWAVVKEESKFKGFYEWRG